MIFRLVKICFIINEKTNLLNKLAQIYINNIKIKLLLNFCAILLSEYNSIKNIFKFTDGLAYVIL
jgi:hypothetical protein